MAKVRHSCPLGRKWLTSALVSLTLFMLTVVLLVLLAMGIFSLPTGDEDSQPHDLSSFRRLVTEKYKKTEEGEPWTEIISWQPRAFLIHNVLSKAECEYLINLAKPDLVKSLVVDKDTGGSRESRVRTSSGKFLRRGQDKIIRGIEKRIAELTFIPSMEKDFMLSTMELHRNMSPTLTTLTTSTISRMEATGWLRFLCICNSQMSKKGARLFFLLPLEISHLCLGGMSCLNAEKEVSP